MNVVSITRKPQALPTTPCPMCRKPAQLMGRIGEPKDGRVTVWLACAVCGFNGEHEIEAAS